ncbi:4-hydroxybenzoate 3-monooxygenase [Pseudonocardia spinosispora]|uniref:4-hydroxybenzoate 3-monooxygenase n=1 Tax=Pseudonocardia spinosispora TaxID=103441 RepID=UPI0004083818|nr:4-hydroxybenzoate 3-monooxygenase [Pseudonocardia spinosispora]
MERTQVAIVGAGPAGLLLGHLLRARGIDTVLLEARSRSYVEQRVRAGVCEHPTVELLRELGLADRLDREGLPHHGISLRFDRADHRIDLTELTGKQITVYGQQEIVKDLIAARLAGGETIEFEVTDVALHDLDTDTPRVTWTDATGAAHDLRCDAIAGCDGFHGISRPAIPAPRFYDHTYPFAWLGVLAETPPSHEELIYARHTNGFALHSMRSPEVTRLYLQVSPDDQLTNWSDARIWDELATRLEVDGDFTLREGTLLEKSITPMRSFVAEPMRHGRLFLAGDAAHIVPPTGAKGMNLAVADVHRLAPALTALLRGQGTEQADTYSDRCLRRVWRAEHFSYFMTTMLHRAPNEDPFADQLQLSQLRYVATSTAAATSLAENYVGLDF